jgi:hypothetical protein
MKGRRQAETGRSTIHLLNCERAFWIGAVEIRISPADGWSRSMIRKIAPATDTAQTSSVMS